MKYLKDSTTAGVNDWPILQHIKQTFLADALPKRSHIERGIKLILYQ